MNEENRIVCVELVCGVTSDAHQTYWVDVARLKSSTLPEAQSTYARIVSALAQPKTDWSYGGYPCANLSDQAHEEFHEAIDSVPKVLCALPCIVTDHLVFYWGY